MSTVVIARYRALAGAGDQVASLLAEHTAFTRREPGCLNFSANRSRDDADEFVLYEEYADDAAFQAHRETPHFKRYVEQQVVPLLAERTWRTYDVIQPRSRFEDVPIT